jgi:hypothetical protein
MATLVSMVKYQKGATSLLKLPCSFHFPLISAFSLVFLYLQTGNSLHIPLKIIRIMDLKGLKTAIDQVLKPAPTTHDGKYDSEAVPSEHRTGFFPDLLSQLKRLPEDAEIVDSTIMGLKKGALVDDKQYQVSFNGTEWIEFEEVANFVDRETHPTRLISPHRFRERE